VPRPPKWIKPQLTRLVDEAPTGDDWLHEIKYDGYRMHARIDGGPVKLLTRTGLDQLLFTGTHKGPLGELLASGTFVKVAYNCFFRFADGKLVKQKGLWDTLSFMQQIKG
jgi:hypothetical protein